MTRHHFHALALAASLALGGCASHALAAPPYQKPTGQALAPTDLVLVQPSNGTGQVTHYASEFGGGGLTVGCDGVASDDQAALQNAINTLQTNSTVGGDLILPVGACNLGATGLVITGNSIRLRGQTVGVLTPGTGSRLLYSGTGSAVTFGTINALNYNDAIDNVLIQATGAASTSATAVGVTLNNNQYLTSRNLGIQGFGAGVGLLVQGNGNAGSCPSGICFTANNTFRDIGFFGNHIGVRSTVVNGGTGENILGLYGGSIIGDLSTGSIGIDASNYASVQGVVDNVDVESYATCYQIGGQGWRGMASHSEFCTQHINLLNTSIHNTFYGHQPSSVTGGYASVWADAGSDNHYHSSQGGGTPTDIGQTLFRPSVDGSEIISLSTANGTILIDTDTRPGSKNLELVNGFPLTCFSDNFATQTCFINSATGAATFNSVTASSLTATSAMTTYNFTANGTSSLRATSVTSLGSGTTPFVVTGSNSHGMFGCQDFGTRALDLCNMANLTLYQDDAGSVPEIILNGQNGNGAFSGLLSSAGVTTTGPLTVNGKLLVNSAAPTYSSGFSTGTPTITGSTSAAFLVTLGATPGATGVLTMPGANTGYVCLGSDQTTAAGTVRETGSTTTTVTFALASTVAADKLQIQCVGY